VAAWEFVVAAVTEVSFLVLAAEVEEYAWEAEAEVAGISDARAKVFRYSLEIVGPVFEQAAF
jgi:hypothetical protein